MNTIQAQIDRVGLVYKNLRQDPEHSANYGVIESKKMAIDTVRNQLQVALESDMNNPYADGPLWATARLTLFNSLYR